jgi:tetratricopeptide (TPR) repeat protein
VFQNAVGCEFYTRQSKDDQIILIVGGQLSFVVVPLSYTFLEISPIHVYYFNLSTHHELASKFNVNQITDLDELINEIKRNQKSREKWFDEPLLVSVCSSVSNEERSFTSIDGDFLYFQLLIDGLLRVPSDQTSRDKFLDLCRKEYQGNHQQLSIINTFEESYVPERALNWYSRHTFLYKMLNKALRFHNINILFLCRFFMQDLYKQLEELQRKQDQILVRVHRGQCMSKKELNVLKESKGQFISMNSFLSTSLVREVSSMFVSQKFGDLCGVLFEIDVNSRLSYGAKPFANISSQSQFEDEQEILFMIGAIFRLVGIEQENEITVIKMKLCNENYDCDMELLLEHMQMANDKYHECFSFGHVLRTAEMHDLAEKFYNRMINELENDHPLVAELWGSIGLVKKAKGELEISFQWLSKSLEKYEQMKDPIGIAKCLQNIANIHQMKGEYNQAINKYNQALNILYQLPGNQINSITGCFNNLGAAYFEQRKFTEARQYYTTVLVIRTTVLPHMHPNIATTLNNLGNVYFLDDEYNYDCALRYFEQALDIFNASSPSEHPTIAQIYYNMALTYLEKRDPQRSLTLLDRVASIYHNTLSSNHPDARRCAKTIDFIKQEYNK